MAWWIRNTPTLCSFKRRLDSDLNAVPKFFFDGKRLGQIYHARLSTLNAYLFSKNIIDSPICVCWAREDTQHFLMSCTRYTNLREELVNRVTPVFRPSVWQSGTLWLITENIPRRTRPQTQWRPLRKTLTSGLGLDDMSLAWPAVVQLLVFIYSGIQ